VTAEAAMELVVEDDSIDGTGSEDDSSALLPDLTAYARDANEPDIRASRAQSALRRSQAGGDVDRVPSSVGRKAVVFQCGESNDSDGRNSGKRLWMFNDNNNAIYIAQIHAQQQMGCL